MIYLSNDYLTGAHPSILKKLAETNFENQVGYGSDDYSKSATKRIKQVFDCPEAQVFFLTGGTQTNQLVISTMLQSYEGVLATKTGHVSVHEAGAIEYTGHKVLELNSHDGKMDAKELKSYLENFYTDSNHEHMVFPGMVYISFPTEYGTLYSKSELTSIYEVCKSYNIPLYIDGARLGYGLCGINNNISPSELAKLCDVFYIGGTKVGALCGEAVVFTHNNAPKCFLTQVKQHGAMLAKGRLVGIQFDVLFSNNLYFEISEHAIEMSEKLKLILKKVGLKLFLDSPTNQQFIILENAKIEKLKNFVEFSFWERYDESHSVIRLATSWSTTEETLISLEEILKQL